MAFGGARAVVLLGVVLIILFHFSLASEDHLQQLRRAEEDDDKVLFAESEDGILHVRGRPGYSVPSQGIVGGQDGEKY